MRRSQALVLIVLPALILASDIVALYFLKETLSHPYIVVEADRDVRLTILQRGFRSTEACESARSAYTNALVLGCATCKVSISTCTKHLNETQKTLLSSTPIASYSASIPNGVVAFNSTTAGIAGTVCRESANSKNGVTPNVVCFEPGVQRFILPTEGSNQDSTIRPAPAIWLVISALILILWASWIRNAQTESLIYPLINLSRRQKQIFTACIDVILVEFSLWLAFTLKTEAIYVPEEESFWLFIAAPILAIFSFVQFGLYQSVIRYLGLKAMMQIAKAVAVYLLLLALAAFLIRTGDIPKSILPIHGTLLLLLIGTIRGIARMYLNQSTGSAHSTKTRRNVAVYGAGAAGVQLVNALSRSKEIRTVAYLDDDPRLNNNRIGELKVYSPGELGALIKKLGIEEVLIAIPSASRQRRREIINSLERLPIQVRTLPALSDLAEGKIKTDDLREVDIDDLLGRDPVTPDIKLINRKIFGKSVMVTGAGGSIGSELCRQIALLKPRCIVLFEQSEYALYRIELELLQSYAQLPMDNKPLKVYPIIGSVTDQARTERVIRAFGVETVYHAAAYKHVPMVESNPCEGVINNAVGTYRAVLAAINQQVETFVLVSTDKAVRPTNTMGATKRLAEMIVQAFASEHAENGSHTNLSVVRFGNVLGSSGSVVPLFREQIRRGGPITVTDPRIVRYFMTISEAAQLVLQAGAMGNNGDVFVLDMGEPVRILDLAQRMIRLTGLQLKSAEHPLGDIEIVFTGLRPGEKLYEELLTGNNPSKTAHPRIMRASEKMLPLATVQSVLKRMEKAALEGDSNETRRLLIEAVEEFHPQCGNEDLVANARTGTDINSTESQ